MRVEQDCVPVEIWGISKKPLCIVDIAADLNHSVGIQLLPCLEVKSIDVWSKQRKSTRSDVEKVFDHRGNCEARRRRRGLCPRLR